MTRWEEALIELEERAKTNARLLFFVFARCTRNVASMVEVAYLSGGPRKMVLLADTYPGPHHIINGEPISARCVNFFGILLCLKDAVWG